MRVTSACRNGMIDSVAVRCNTGYLRFYSGTRPTDANTALSGNTLLAELRFGATAFAAASAGSATANAITQDSSADATGTATFARVFESDGTTVVGDISVGTSGQECNLVTTSLVAGQPVQVTSFQIQQGGGT